MKLKTLLYGNSIGKIKSLLQEIKLTGKIKEKKKVWKFTLPDIEYSSLSTKDMLIMLEIDSSNA